MSTVNKGPDAATRPDWFGGYIFDLDGTMYLGDALLPGAAEVIQRIRERHLPLLFLSNNPTKSIHQYVRKLQTLGIMVEPAEILTSLATTVYWLRMHHPGAIVFPIGEGPLVDALGAAGIAMSDNAERIDIVIASYDRGFDYRKLQIAFDAIHVHKRAILVATNPDRYCPFPGGRGEPDTAAIVGAIQGCTGIACTQVFGKPEPVMLDAALARIGVPLANCVMVGDRLMTDVEMAHRAGMTSALVLTGDSTRDDLRVLPPTAGRPTFVLDQISQLLPSPGRDGDESSGGER